MLKIQNLHASVEETSILKGIDLEVNAGETHAIMGPNGSGKSTLIKCLLGLVIPNRGSMTINDEVIKNKWTYKNNITYMPQIVDFPPNLKVLELIDMIKKIRSDYQTQSTSDSELIEIFHLEPFLNKKFSSLSGGTKQKVNIVLTFMFDAPLIILDEPTSGLDPVSLIKLKKLIISRHKTGSTFIITSHIMSFVESISKEIIFLIEGKVAFDGSIKKLKSMTKKNSLEKSIAEIMVNNNA